MRSPYETKNILLLKATALAGALAARHECPGVRSFPSTPTQRLFLSLATRKVLIGGLPAGERDGANRYSSSLEACTRSTYRQA